MKHNQLHKKYIRLLKEFVTFKTVSTDPSFKPEMNRAVSWMAKLFKSYGFEVKIFEGKDYNPVIVAKYVTDPAYKTVLVYGHYDVQPADKSDGWKTDPFILTRKNDRFVGRGVIDNKGQILAHMVAVLEAIENGTLGSNITFIIEGNEESGNPGLAKLIAKNKKLLACDLIFISDGETIGKHPSIETSFRGGGNLRVTYATSSNDRHSGLYGGAIPNAALEISRLASKIKNNRNEVEVESFYEGIRPITDSQKKASARLNEVESLQKIAHVRTLTTEAGLDPYSQTGLRPTIEISGMTSGYAGVGFKNIVPCKAEIRLNIRTVYPQNSKKIIDAVKVFIRKETPSYVDLAIEGEETSDPIALDVSHQSIVKIREMLKTIYQKEVFYHHVGGGIPVVADFHSVFGKPIALVPFANSDCNMHGVDENFSIYHLNKALEFATTFWTGR